MVLSNRRAPITAVLAGIIAIASLGVGAAPVLAHEFTVGILLDPSATRSAAFMKGFQLAVDQSPDVSHPVGEEGGDHLGSLDVLMEVRDGARRPDRFVNTALRLIKRQGAPIIVADVSPVVLAALQEPVAETGTMLIAVTADGQGADDAATRFFFAAGEQSGARALLTDRDPPFADAFAAAYGRDPSAAAARGYIAGRLVDLGVEATDEDPFDTKTLAAALVAATATAEAELPSGGSLEGRVACDIARLFSPFQSDWCIDQSA